MGDLLRTGLNNQKREVNVAIAQVTAADIATALVPANAITGQLAVAANTALVGILPERVLVTNVHVSTLVASLNALETVDVLVNGVVVANENVVGVVGIGSPTIARTYFATGGQITVVPGLVPPTGTAMSIEVVIEYIELDKTEGSYIG